MMVWLRRLHAWIGLGLCLLLALIAITGASLVFRPQIRDLGRPAPSAPATADLPGLVALTQAKFGPDAFSSITFAGPQAAWSEVRLRDGRHAWIDHHDQTVRPYSGTDGALEWLFDLHHQFLSGDTGELFVGTIGLFGAAMAIVGVIIWWPARRSFNATVVPRRPGRTGWLAAHRDLGVMVAPLVLLSMISGASLALPDIARPLYQAPAPKAPKGVKVGKGPTDWNAAIATAQARFPAATVRMVVAPGKPGQPASIRLRQPCEWHANGRTIVYLNPPTGQIVGLYDAQGQATGARLYNGLWPVHAARVGGGLWQVVIFLSGVSLAALSLYGGEAYRKRLFQKKPGRPR